MNLKEISFLLGFSSEKIKALIADGVALPKSKELVKLAATGTGAATDISEEDVDAFLARFEAEDLGRNPPVWVRRELLVEAKHHCAICRQAHPPQFHHILDWDKINHHDPKHMLMICGSCHSKCGNGIIDTKAQYAYKARLSHTSENDPFVDAKREDDKAILSKLLRDCPLSMASFYLRQLAKDRVHISMQEFLEYAQIDFYKPTFHLHDKELYRLWKEVFDPWTHADNISTSIFHDFNLKGIATLFYNEFNPPASWDEYNDFHRLVGEAYAALGQLNTYVKEHYFELGINDLDRAGQKDYAEWSEPDPDPFKKPSPAAQEIIDNIKASIEE